MAEIRREGLSAQEAAARLKQYGSNSLKLPRRGRGLLLFLSQFKSFLILLLIFAAILSFSLRGPTEATLICSIVILSGLLGYFQEKGALNAIEKLLQLVAVKTLIRRDGKEEQVLIEQVVPGDIVLLHAGDLVPADCQLLEANHFFVDEAALTGESFPVEKTANTRIFLGTSVTSGIAVAFVTETGISTKYGKIAEHARFHSPMTAFEKGIHRFSFFLFQVTLILVSVIFAFNALLHRPIIEAFLFSLALAVGLTPQLLPAIIAVNLSHGARRMAKKGVITKRLASIENLGQMDVLCSDKTGTITMGAIQYERAVGTDGSESEKTALYGFLNAHFQVSYGNPLDKAILKGLSFNAGSWNKIKEIPYDFNRKRLSIVLEKEGKRMLIAKGAVPQILEICTSIEWPDGSIAPLEEFRERMMKSFEEQSEQGFRTLAVAYGEEEEEERLIFLGFLYFSDPIKPDIQKTIASLKEQGIHLKIITGDHWAVAAHIASIVGMEKEKLYIGKDLQQLDEEALRKIVSEKDIFAEIDPSEKERLILALRQMDHVVGYLGDGVNDIPALHSADVSIAVNNGADAAKEVSDIVLLHKDLSVLREGVEEGRRTFVNTMKYVFMATSTNFGNMFSMAGASLFLPFLPLLPMQVLLTNFFSDLPEMALATDRVDVELVKSYVKWDHRLIRRFMLIFGALNSAADYLTFGVLLFFFQADEILFRSGWFIENVITAAFIVLAIRTRRFLFRSKPGRLLLCAVFSVMAIVLILPSTSLGALFQFGPIPISFYLPLALILVIYIVAVEIAKQFFFRRRA